MTDKDTMPDEIYAWMGMQDNGSWDRTDDEVPYFEKTKYHHDDRYQAVVKERDRYKDALLEIINRDYGWLSSKPRGGETIISINEKNPICRYKIRGKYGEIAKKALENMKQHLSAKDGE